MKVKHLAIIGIFIIAIHPIRGLSQDNLDSHMMEYGLGDKYLFSEYYGTFRGQLLKLDTLSLDDFIADTLMIRGYEDNDPVLYAEHSLINSIVLFFLQDNNNFQLEKMRNCNDLDECFVAFEGDIVWVEDMWFIKTHEGYRLFGIYADSRKCLELFFQDTLNRQQ